MVAYKGSCLLPHQDFWGDPLAPSWLGSCGQPWCPAVCPLNLGLWLCPVNCGVWILPSCVESGFIFFLNKVGLETEMEDPLTPDEMESRREPQKHPPFY